MEDQKLAQQTVESANKKQTKVCKCGRQYHGRYNLCSPCLAKEDEETEYAIEQWKFRRKRY